ncbi:MAG: peptidylprolyl isomerase [Bryobacteraceae bacterium]
MKRRAFLASALALATGCSRKNTVETGAAPAAYRVQLKTTKGSVILLVHRDWSPRGADHFYELTKAGFYNGDAFFRVVPGFVVQWGVNADPKVNQRWSEISIQDDPPKVSNKAGTIVFAKLRQPDSRTTQVFINLRDNSALLDPQGFTPFGEVVQGMDVIQHLYAGYGDGPPSGNGPNQHQIAAEGNQYLKENFPKLDYIETASVL